MQKYVRKHSLVLLFLLITILFAGCTKNEDTTLSITTTASEEVQSTPSTSLTYTNGFAPKTASELTADATDIQVKFGEKDWEVLGTLTLPKGESLSAVVLVGGSGPTDRDSTILANKPLRDIAKGLVEQGIAVLRFDKRTLVHKEKYALPENGDFVKNMTVYEEFIDDTASAYQLLKNVPEIDKDKIFILGHSLGGNQMPRIIEKTVPAGAIIMAGNVTPIQRVIYYQYKYLLEASNDPAIDIKLKQIETFVDYIEADDYNENSDPGLSFGLFPKYILGLKSYNPAEHLSRLNTKTLILQGDRDYQVRPAELDLWKESLGNKAEYKLYKGLNHIFMYGTEASQPSEYSVESSVSSEVINDIAIFIKNATDN